MNSFESELRRYKSEIDDAEKRKQSAIEEERRTKLALAEQASRERERVLRNRNMEIARPFYDMVSGLLEATARAEFGSKVGKSFEINDLDDGMIAQWTAGIIKTQKKSGDKVKISTDFNVFGDDSYWSTEECFFSIYLFRDPESTLYFSDARYSRRPEKLESLPMPQNNGVETPPSYTENTSESQLKILLRDTFIRGPGGILRSKSHVHEYSSHSEKN